MGIRKFSTDCNFTSLTVDTQANVCQEETCQHLLESCCDNWGSAATLLRYQALYSFSRSRWAILPYRPTKGYWFKAFTRAYKRSFWLTSFKRMLSLIKIPAFCMHFINRKLAKIQTVMMEINFPEGIIKSSTSLFYPYLNLPLTSWAPILEAFNCLDCQILTS